MQQFESHETQDGYIIFRNKVTNHMQLQDPHLAAVTRQIAVDHDRIANPIYRVAAKVSALARTLHTSHIPFATITNIMERHRLRHTDNAPHVRAAQLTALLHDIFYAAEKMGLINVSTSAATSGASHPNHPVSPPFTIDRAVESVSNLLWNVFDRDRNRPLSVLQLKQTFLLLCQPPQHDRLIYEHFLLAADHNGCVSRMRFESLVVVMSQLFWYVDATAAEQHFAVECIDGLLHACFAMCPGPVGLNKFQFYAVWRQTGPIGSAGGGAGGSAPFEPYASVYAAVVRMAEARDVLHLGVVCAACDRTPVRGLLFRCLQCRRVAVCFGCYAASAPLAPGSGGNRHEPSHRMEEIGCSTQSTSSTNAANRWRSLLHKVGAFFALCPADKVATSNLNIAAAADGADAVDNITMETHVLELGGIGCRSEKTEPAVKGECHRGDLGGSMEAPTKMVKANGKIEDVSRTLSTTMSSVSMGRHSGGGNMQRLVGVIAALGAQNEKLASWMDANHPTVCGGFGKTATEFLHAHHTALTNVVLELQQIQQNEHKQSSNRRIAPHSSTPYRGNSKQTPAFSLAPSSSSGFSDGDFHHGGNSGTTLALSIKGAEINRSFIEANKSDLSIGDLSQWFHTRRTTADPTAESKRRESVRTMPTALEEHLSDNDMSHFKQLLHIVKDIIDDSYSDNAELSRVTTQLENVLGQIIDVEEKRRVRLFQATESICV